MSTTPIEVMPGDAAIEPLASDSIDDFDAATKIDEERDALLRATESGQLDTVHQRVAWILNHYRDARDSDVALQLAYWDVFEPDTSTSAYIHKLDLYKLPRLTSLSRARATIQNKYQLFLASPNIRKRRGTLSEEERQKIAEQEPAYPTWAVYADESGKQSARVVVGSVWFLHAPSLWSLQREILGWRRQRQYEAELHFTDISKNNLGYYLDFSTFLSARSSTMSFKAVSMDREGVRNIDEAVGRLYYHLLINGIEHEDMTQRAPLPRNLQLVKDAEEAGRDQLLLAELDDKLKQAAASRFNRQLTIDRLYAMDSASQPFLQIADLYAGSVNRILATNGDGTSHKDEFARHFLRSLGASVDNTQTEQDGDKTIHLIL
jgi:hypothetical protein